MENFGEFWLSVIGLRN